MPQRTDIATVIERNVLMFVHYLEVTVVSKVDDTTFIVEDGETTAVVNTYGWGDLQIGSVQGLMNPTFALGQIFFDYAWVIRN